MHAILVEEKAIEEENERTEHSHLEKHAENVSVKLCDLSHILSRAGLCTSYICGSFLNLCSCVSLSREDMHTGLGVWQKERLIKLFHPA